MARTASSRLDIPLYRRANEAIAHGALTNSKRASCFVNGVYPVHLTRGQGCHAWDTQGNKYVDFILGLGTTLLGHGNEEIAEEIGKWARRGTSLSLGTDLEVECAEKVKELFPWVDRVRFLKTGTDACSAALRIARTVSGHSGTISVGYHGWSDDFVSLTPPALGVPRRQWMKAHRDAQYGYGAFITEPVQLDASDANAKTLAERVTIERQAGAVYIADEIITGFRYPRYSVSRHHGIEPDLICLGKAIANGSSLAVVAGKKAIMECDEYFVSSTYAGETTALAAGLKTMTLLQTKYQVEELWTAGERFLKDFNSIWPGGVWIEGYPTRGVFRAESELTKALFWQECVRAGLLFGPSWFYGFGHIPLHDQVLSTCKDVITRVRTGSVKLEGEMPKTPFAQSLRDRK